MEHFCNSTNQLTNTKNCSEHYYKSLDSLPTSILHWAEENTNNILVIFNDVGKLVFVTKSVKDILGYDPRSLLGVNWKTTISTADVHHIETNIKDLGDKHETLLIHVPDQMGKNISFECTIKKTKNEDNLILYACMLKDITSEKESEEMMVRSEKMSVAGQLAAGIAHEIRNPLTSLKGFLQLLQAGVDQKEAYYKIMIDEIDKIETITSELLFISKPLTNNKRQESMNNMIDEILVLLEPQAKLRNIKLEWNKQKEKYIYCDRSQIKQVLINLVKNAIEASEDSSIVQVEVHSTEKEVLIDVVDEGSGVSEEIIHKLDEPFFTTKQNGTGLGLMITKNILNQHHANLEVVQNKTKGTTFRIHVPVEEKS